MLYSSIYKRAWVCPQMFIALKDLLLCLFIPEVHLSTGLLVLCC